MIVNSSIERFRIALKRDPEKAAIVLELYGVYSQQMEHEEDERERLAALRQMIDELSREEILSILTYALQLKAQKAPSNILPINS